PVVDTDLEHVRQDLVERLNHLEERVRADLTAHAERLNQQLTGLRSELVERDRGAAEVQGAKWDAHVGPEGDHAHLEQQRAEDIGRTNLVLTLIVLGGTGLLAAVAS